MLNNYGFRPGKSINQALTKIKHWNSQNISFFLKYNVTKIFNNINWKRLKNIFNKYVYDNRFWVGILSMLKSFLAFELQAIFEQKRLTLTNNLSYLLFNIYMHELD